MVVGTGSWAEKHLAAYALCRNVEAVGLVGHRNAERLTDLGAAHELEARFMDLEKAIADVGPDMVDIATSPRYRLEGVRACVGTGVKLVNVEKPMALTPSEAYEIESLCREHGLLLTVNHQKKFNAPWARAARLIRDGGLGDIRFYRATCKLNMLEQGTHLIDMLLFFEAYRPIRWVMGQVDDLDGLDKETTPAPDSCSASMCFDDDTRATVAMGKAGWEIPGETERCFHFGVEAYGTEGFLNIALNKTLAVTSFRTGKTTLEPSSWEATFVQGLADHLDAAAAYVRSPAAGHTSCLENSMLSFQAVMALYASSVGGGRVDPTRRSRNMSISVPGLINEAWSSTRYPPVGASEGDVNVSVLHVRAADTRKRVPLFMTALLCSGFVPRVQLCPG